MWDSEKFCYPGVHFGKNKCLCRKLFLCKLCGSRAQLEEFPPGHLRPGVPGFPYSHHPSMAPFLTSVTHLVRMLAVQKARPFGHCMGLHPLLEVSPNMFISEDSDSRLV